MPTAENPSITQRGATSVGVASIAAAASGLLVLFIAARQLSPADYAVFLTFWSLLFAMFGLLGGVQNETTRAVRSARSDPQVSHRPRALPSGLVVGLCLAAVLAATSFVWAPALFDSHRTVVVLAVCAGVVVFAGHSALVGALSGAGRWGTCALLVGSEAVTRLLVVLVVGATTLGLAGFEVAAAAAAGVWLLLLPLLPAVRAAALERADVDLGAFARNVGQSMVASAATATIVVGFPVALRLTTDSATYAGAAPLVLAILLTRAPLIIPLTAYQGVAITHFLDNRDRGPAILVRTSGIILAAAAVGAGLAAAVGPWLMRTVFGAAYDVSPGVLAALMMVAGLLGVLTLTGSAVLALGRHTAYAGGWSVASIVTLGLLLLPLSIEARVIISLATGPLVGIAAHAVWIARTARRGKVG